MLRQVRIALGLNFHRVGAVAAWRPLAVAAVKVIHHLNAAGHGSNGLERFLIQRLVVLQIEE